MDMNNLKKSSNNITNLLNTSYVSKYPYTEKTTNVNKLFLELNGKLLYIISLIIIYNEAIKALNICRVLRALHKC